MIGRCLLTGLVVVVDVIWLCRRCDQSLLSIHFFLSFFVGVIYLFFSNVECDSSMAPLGAAARIAVRTAVVDDVLCLLFLFPPPLL